MHNETSSGLSKKEDLLLSSLLKKWQKNGEGIFSDLTYSYLAEIVPATAIETIIFRKRNNIIEVLLLKRDEHDPIWPGMLNCPGKLLRRSDFYRDDNDPLNGALERIQKDELGCRFLSRPKFVDIIFLKNRRGPVTILCYLAKIDENAKIPVGAKWVKYNKISVEKSFIDSETKPINSAYGAYNV